MSDRSHLSIGEVLNLLQDEFPDITISKIRFLESQGLLDPERTPSGYRKFYEGDIERLRWILRQQKENFLPLKVIKDRLASGEIEGDGPTTIAAETPPAPVDEPTTSARPATKRAPAVTDAPPDEALAPAGKTAGARSGRSERARTVARPLVARPRRSRWGRSTRWCRAWPTIRRRCSTPATPG